MTNELVSTKYTFACDPDECDVLIELTSSDGFGFPSGVMEITCPCGRKPVLLSVVNATIAPSTTTKEDNMESTTNEVPASYDENLEITYKVIRGYSDAEYATSKIGSLEWDLHNGRQSQKTATMLQGKISTVKDIITEAYGDSEDQETLRAIAEALGIPLTRTVEWTASIEVSGTFELDLLEDEDTDIESEITENLYVESQHGNIEVIDQEVIHVREC